MDGWRLPGSIVGYMVGAVLFWSCPAAGAAEPEQSLPTSEMKPGTETSRAAGTEGREELPREWLEEILENQEMLESLELLEKLELFEGESRFSPHHF